MTQSQITFDLINHMAQTSDLQYLANWEMLNQALFHPLVNAVKFSKLNSRIKMTLRMQEIDSKLATLQCVVKDKGKGIAREQLKSLFQEFTNGDQRQLERDESGAHMFDPTRGFSLGLSTTKSLARVQDGHVHVKSDLGLYTAVTITIRV